MGTSKSFETPGGGAWTSPKRQLTDHITGQEPLDPNRFVRTAVRAVGGIGMKPRFSSGEVGSLSSGSRGGGGNGSGSGGSSGGSAALSGAVQGLGGFGADVAYRGLDAALGSLGLQDLHGKSAAEVIGRVAEHLSRSATGKQAEVLETALRDTIFDIAALEGDGSYGDLESALQSFLDRYGLDGFVESFLTQYVFTAIWSFFENHADAKLEGASNDELAVAIESACRSLVSQELKDLREAQQFNSVDWFGQTGRRFADSIVGKLRAGF